MQLPLLILMAIIVTAVVWSMLRASSSFAPWIPSSAAMAIRAFDYIKPAAGMRFADLGCGDGRIVFLAAKRYRLFADGYETSILPLCLARVRQVLAHQSRARIKMKNLFQANLSKYDIIYVYGLPEHLNKSLAPKLIAEMRPGTWLISYNFSLDRKKPVTEFHDRWRNCYLYRF